MLHSLYTRCINNYIASCRWSDSLFYFVNLVTYPIPAWTVVADQQNGIPVFLILVFYSSAANLSSISPD